MAPSDLHDQDQSTYPGVYKQSSTSLSNVILTHPLLALTQHMGIPASLVLLLL